MPPTPGAWPVVLTPFSDSDAVDTAALARYVDWLIDRGSAGLFAGALSGEMYELCAQERCEVARVVVDRAAGRVPVAGAVVGDAKGDAASSVASLIGETRALVSAGVDVAVFVAATLASADEPEDAVLQRAHAVAEAVPRVDLGIYECPLPYHRVLSEPAIARLAATGRFTFFKETSHDIDRMGRRVADAEGTPLRVFNAGIENYAESIEVGVAGLSGWVVNVAPDLVERLGALVAREGLSSRVRDLQAALVEVESRMGPTYPASAKALVERRAHLGWTPRSRWRPADIDLQLVDELVDVIASADAASS